MATSRRGLFGRRVRLLAALLLAARAACFGPAAHRVAPRAPSRCAGPHLLAEPVEGSGRLGRRTTRIDFTCKACGSRTTRMINPEAYLTGVVIVQCGSATCGKHHVIADNIDYLERGFKNVVEYGKANGIPGILLKGAVELPRSEVSVTHDAAAGGGGGGEGGGAGALGAGAGP